VKRSVEDGWKCLNMKNLANIEKASAGGIWTEFSRFADNSRLVVVTC